MTNVDGDLSSRPERSVVFLRLIDIADKAQALRDARHGSQGKDIRYVRTFGELKAVPLTPFAYWLSEDIRALFTSSARTGEFVETRMGMGSLNDFRFVRLTWEVLPLNGWERYAKGESKRPFLDNCACVVNWVNAGQEVKAYVAAKVGSASRRIQAQSYYFRAGLTWIRRTSHLRTRCMPSGFIFSGGAQAAFVIDDTSDNRLGFLGLSNSTVYDALIKVSVGRTGDAVQFEPGMIIRAPWPRPIHLPPELGRLARIAWQGWFRLDTAVEVSHAFVVPALLQVEGRSFGVRVGAWAERVASAHAELGRVQSEIDDLCFELYEISEEDRRAIVEGFGVSRDAGKEDGFEIEVDDADDERGEVVELDSSGLAAGLVSWAVGVAVGRFDVRLATGERTPPKEPDLFDPLPVCSPGMLTGDDGLPSVVPPLSYPVEVSAVLVDDPGHPLDITTAVRSVFDAVFGDEADAWWADIGVALGAKGGEVGAWLGKGFFDHHLRSYSKSRRKAPILWPLGTRSGSYLVWLYAHRVSVDSLFQVLNDVVVPKLQVEERELTQLRQDAGVDPTASQRKAIDQQERFVDELRELREELEAVASLWAPDLNDGIVIVLAPLWRLFAHHRVWSNELKKHWAKLAKGDYDWARLAMHLWPERVVPKCAEDCSLAMAHGLDDLFWVQDPDNDDKWHPRQIPTAHIDQLVAQRHTPATSLALQRMANR